MTKLVPDADGKAEVCRCAREEDISSTPDRLVVGIAQAAPAKEAMVMRFFIVRDRGFEEWSVYQRLLLMLSGC